MCARRVAAHSERGACVRVLSVRRGWAAASHSAASHRPSVLSSQLRSPKYGTRIELCSLLVLISLSEEKNVYQNVNVLREELEQKLKGQMEAADKTKGELEGKAKEIEDKGAEAVKKMEEEMRKRQDEDSEKAKTALGDLKTELTDKLKAERVARPAVPG